MVETQNRDLRAPLPGRNLHSVSSNDDLRTRLAVFDAEIAQLQTSLDQLILARAPVASALDSIVYPILTLPPEITAEIFLHYVDDEPLKLPKSYRRNRISGPPLLASVCQAWRGIAIHLQTLWSDIKVDDTASETLIQCCLARAKDHPLSLNLKLFQPDGHRILTAFASHVMQWESIKWKLEFPVVAQMNEIQGRLVLLKKLVLARYAMLSVPETATPITGFASAPMLREVHLHDIPPALVLLPWAQLTYLSCWRHTTQEIFEMLHQTRDLEKLNIHDPEDFQDEAPPPVQLRNLHTLMIWDCESFRFLDNLSLPVLKRLILSNDSQPASPSELLDLFVRSGCRLYNLTATDFEYGFVLPLLEAMPTLSIVRLFDMNWDRDTEVISLFKRITNDAEFLPNLGTLRIDWPFYGVPYEEVIQMLESRRYNRGDLGKLQVVRFECGSWSDQAQNDMDVDHASALMERLKALAADGLEIYIPDMTPEMR
ncbi:hypothetical protein C8F04DRAFT_198418 [Mycena alexandri]|uniref:F-box domain-containing protein n=1 Tax=Mycena alexandri TaxID=1745969 RepID=A0AAD6S2V1_9AGAR|nr:hypothetical protein C8F04DRAFT_307675 [Mycena alexandri]KAJ7022982.1 hypothetical protein C8F04DRAFT_198418 [Mycena alexandri]